jgi:hypothetical protein
MANISFIVSQLIIDAASRHINLKTPEKHCQG